MIMVGNPPHLECSSKGYRNLSAFFAKIHGDTIENQYQAAKMFEDGTTGYSPKDAKAKQKTCKIVNLPSCHNLYKKLWRDFLYYNPEEIDKVREFNGLSDMFGQEGHICQAEVIWDIVNTVRNVPVFVFGSNLQGKHGNGAAKYAVAKYGARYGLGNGRCGWSSYAIPTKLDYETSLYYTEMLEFVDKFLDYAAMYPRTKFHLTKVGAGKAGISPHYLKEFLETHKITDNVILPGVWDKSKPRRLIIAGSRKVPNKSVVYSHLNHMHRHVCRWDEIIVGGAPGIDTIGEDWARSIGYADSEINVMKALWSELPGIAGFYRNAEMAWRGTHLLAFWDGVSPGTADMIQQATSEGLIVKVIHI